MKRFVQFLQAALACAILVALIFSIPVVMAQTPIHFDISLMSPERVLSSHQMSNGQVPTLIP
ncbi:MAG TPA: hypothetical protein PKE16_15090 [Hyphomicrobium sp.]|nr:hypothetical protein [Hyphomicrobium sp.]